MKFRLPAILSAALLSILAVSCTRCSLGGPGVPETVTVMTYNVENIFDAVDNGTEYREFDPGVSDWTVDLYYQRMFGLAEVIGSACDGGPDILVLQEVEHAGVVEDLKGEVLKRFRYRYSAVTDIPDSAVQLAVLSRYPLSEPVAHGIRIAGTSYRDILEVTVVIGARRLVVFNNHWKSKSGGAEETEPARIMAAEVLRRTVRELLAETPDADIVVLGDLNENADEAVRTAGAYPTALRAEGTGGSPPGTEAGGLVLTGGASAAAASGGELFYSPWLDPDRSAEQMPGSYYYNNGWETIDHVLLAGTLFDGKGFSYGSFSPVAQDFMLTEGGYPRRWSMSRRSGYSDHLPLLLTLTVEEE